MNDTTKWEKRYDEKIGEYPWIVQGDFKNAMEYIKEFIRDELSSQKQAVEKLIKGMRLQKGPTISLVRESEIEGYNNALDDILNELHKI